MLFTIVRLNRSALADCDLFKQACPSIKFVYLDWLTSYLQKFLLGGHGKARRTVKCGQKLCGKLFLIKCSETRPREKDSIS